MTAPKQKLKRDSKRSREIFAKAEKLLVGGVNSPVRAFRSVNTDPLIIERGEAQYLYDVDGNKYLDYVCSWGAMLLGHANPAVTSAIADQAKRGTSYGVTTELEVELAAAINRAIPAMEKIRFVSSGTEATMSAVRLARGVTQRDFLLKFRGCYHGHADSFLSEAGSGLATLGIAECPGVPQSLAQLTLNVAYNDLNAVEHVFSEHKDQIAAIIVEPIAANMGVVLPEPGFLAGLREITRKHGALLIVDEVITGFRIHNGAVQQFLGIEADLTTLGKIIGGGLPVAAYGGRAELMNHIAPLGPVYQAGTLAGNPLAMRRRHSHSQATERPRSLPRHRRKGDRLTVASAKPDRHEDPRPSEHLPAPSALSSLPRIQSPTTPAPSVRHKALRPLLPRNVRPRHLPRPVAIRSRLRRTCHTQADIDSPNHCRPRHPGSHRCRQRS